MVVFMALFCARQVHSQYFLPLPKLGRCPTQVENGAVTEQPEAEAAPTPTVPFLISLVLHAAQGALD